MPPAPEPPRSAPPLRPRAILLDLDGTLADSLQVMRLAYRAFLAQFGAPHSDAEFDSLNGPPLAEVVRRLKATHTLPGEAPALLENYFAIIDRTYAEVLPSPGAKALLQKAKRNHCTVGVVTSNSALRTRAWLSAAGLADLVDFVVAGEDVAQGKPHPEAYARAATKAGCALADIVAVEDSPQGATSALAAGLKTFMLGDASDPALPMQAEPIASFGALANRLWPLP
ncbi:MAG TPA: HAD family phosphatase [Burkholderiales bacterium]|nr:HAD family phosphatase [Burkholderiales bacterium]